MDNYPSMLKISPKLLQPDVDKRTFDVDNGTAKLFMRKFCTYPRSIILIFSFYFKRLKR